jgi:uncharacterized protein (DUF2461 family)
MVTRSLLRSVNGGTTRRQGWPAGVQGWPVEAIEFYEGLAADNTKRYWQANRETYERCVKAPMEELLAELADEHGPGRIFRPYRDVRFTKDESPYRLNCAAHLPAATSRCPPRACSSVTEHRVDGRRPSRQGWPP